MRLRKETPRRLIVALLALGVGPIGFGVVLATRPSPLAFGLTYPAFLAWFVVGLVLAARSRGPRRWLMTAPLPHVWMLAVWLVARRSPGTLLGSMWLLRVGLVLNLAWLAAGCGVAAFGWWSYACGSPRPAREPAEGAA
jgi:hypothetical protein